MVIKICRLYIYKNDRRNSGGTLRQKETKRRKREMREKERQIEKKREKERKRERKERKGAKLCPGSIIINLPSIFKKKN